MTRLMRSGAALLVVAAACTDAPTSAPLVADFSPLAAVTGGPDPANPNSWEGDLYICKDGTPTGVAFPFTYTVYADPSGTVMTSGSVNVNSGTCQKVADVTPAVSTTQVWAYATVTEGTLPANWALTNITVVQNRTPTGRAPASTSVANKQATGVWLGNDVGAVVTFFNTYTPPPPPGPACTLTQGFWKNHTELWDATGEKVVTTSQTFFGSGLTYIQIMNTPPSGGNSYLQLAHQYIAAVLNVNGGSDPTVNAALATAAGYFTNHTAGSYFKKDAAWTTLAGTLASYNEGSTGPGHCED